MPVAISGLSSAGDNAIMMGLVSGTRIKSVCWTCHMVSRKRGCVRLPSRPAEGAASDPVTRVELLTAGLSSEIPRQAPGGTLVAYFRSLLRSVRTDIPKMLAACVRLPRQCSSVHRMRSRSTFAIVRPTRTGLLSSASGCTRKTRGAADLPRLRVDSFIRLLQASYLECDVPGRSRRRDRFCGKPN